MVVVLSHRPWTSVHPVVEGELVEDYSLHWDRKFGDGFLPVFTDEAEARILFPDCAILTLTVDPIQRVIRGGNRERTEQS